LTQWLAFLVRSITSHWFWTNLEGYNKRATLFIFNPNATKWESRSEDFSSAWSATTGSLIPNVIHLGHGRAQPHDLEGFRRRIVATPSKEGIVAYDFSIR
jgi:hypothetical protein